MSDSDRAQKKTPQGYEMPLCEALGRVEGEWGDDLVVADAYCQQGSPFPEDVPTDDLHEFVEAVQHYINENHE